MAGWWRVGFSLLWLLFAWQLAAQPVRIVTKAWPGLTQPDLSGAYFELVRLVLPPEQYPPHIQLTVFSRALILVERGQADLVLGVSHADAGTLLLSEQPMDSDQIVAVFDAQRLSMPVLSSSDVGNIPDLSGYRLAWDLAYNYGAALALSNEGFEVQDAQQGIELVAKGRIDIYLAEATELQAHDLQSITRYQLKVQPLTLMPIYVGFSPSEAGARLKARWDERVLQLSSAGTLQDFYRRHPDMVLPGGSNSQDRTGGR